MCHYKTVCCIFYLQIATLEYSSDILTGDRLGKKLSKILYLSFLCNFPREVSDKSTSL